MTFKNLFMSFGLVASLGMSVSCTEPADDDATPGPGDGTCVGKCDGTDDAKPACEGSVKGVDQLELSAEQINALGDPFALKVLRQGDDCPAGFDEVMAKLRETDADGCESETSGINSFVVSESAQLKKKATDYRVVVNRKCKDVDPADAEKTKTRPAHGLLFSLFGVSPSTKESPTPLPQTVEVMSFDEARGVFNFYEVSASGEIEFFGDSHDYLRFNNGLETAPGAVGRCAGCHVGGGMVMKELDTPWVHWEGHEDTPGAADLVKSHTSLGSKSSGSSMESITKAGNRAFNPSRLQLLRAEGTARDVLRPVFCPVEVNLDNGAAFRSTKDVTLGKDFFFDPNFKGGFGGPSLKLSDAIYTAALEKAGQSMRDRSGEVTDAEGNVERDTIFRFTFVERAHIDNDYVEHLISQALIDDETVSDIMAVEFTRPVFSDARCGLLEHVPALTGMDLTAEAIKAGLIESLEGVEEPSAAEAALLNNLTSEEATRSSHEKAADAFLEACKARPEAEFADDVLKVNAARRNRATQQEFHGVFEFALTLPQDDLELDGSEHFDPETCEVVTD